MDKETNRSQELADTVSQMHEFLARITAETYPFLERILPKIASDWLESLVQPHIRNRGFDPAPLSIERLDLAALLNVMGANWRAISATQGLAYEGLNYIKEMVAIRNRWAHHGSVPVGTDLVYRDVDTMLRFCEVIAAGRTILTGLKEARLALLKAFDVETLPVGGLPQRRQVSAAVRPTPSESSVSETTSSSKLEAASRRTLNEAMAIVLREAGPEGLTVGEIHRRVVERDLFRQKDGTPVVRQQVQNRAARSAPFVTDRSVTPMVVRLRQP